MQPYHHSAGFSGTDVWRIGDYGFEMRLRHSVPGYLQYLAPLFSVIFCNEPESGSRKFAAGGFILGAKDSGGFAECSAAGEMKICSLRIRYLPGMETCPARRSFMCYRRNCSVTRKTVYWCDGVWSRADCRGSGAAAGKSIAIALDFIPAFRTDWFKNLGIVLLYG